MDVRKQLTLSQKKYARIKRITFFPTYYFQNLKPSLQRSCKGLVQDREEVRLPGVFWAGNAGNWSTKRKSLEVIGGGSSIPMDKFFEEVLLLDPTSLSQCCCLYMTIFVPFQLKGTWLLVWRAQSSKSCMWLFDTMWLAMWSIIHIFHVFAPLMDLRSA